MIARRAGGQRCTSSRVALERCWGPTANGERQELSSQPDEDARTEASRQQAGDPMRPNPANAEAPHETAPAAVRASEFCPRAAIDRWRDLKVGTGSATRHLDHGRIGNVLTANRTGANTNGRFSGLRFLPWVELGH